MNDLVMIDTSAWIKYFRNSDSKIADIVQNLIETNKAAICGIIEMEIFNGIKSKSKLNDYKDLFSEIEYFEMAREDFRNAGMRMSRLRENGITVSPTDTIIAELCIRNKLNLLTTDADFNHFKELEKI